MWSNSSSWKKKRKQNPKWITANRLIYFKSHTLALKYERKSWEILPNEFFRIVFKLLWTLQVSFEMKASMIRDNCPSHLHLCRYSCTNNKIPMRIQRAKAHKLKRMLICLQLSFYISWLQMDLSNWQL